MQIKKRILICDDDPLLIELLAYRLASREYDVVTASDGNEARIALEASKIDAVILDAMMPIMDGFQVLRWIRKESKTKDVPVIMLTARKQERDVVDALNLGATDFMVKPFIPEELVARVARMLAQNR